MIDTNKMKRAELVPLLTTAAIRIALKIGVAQKVRDQLGVHLTATFQGFTIIYRTPKAMIFTAPTAYGVDIWYEGKCFSVAWNSEKLRDYQIINFRRGPWIPALLAFSQQVNNLTVTEELLEFIQRRTNPGKVSKP